MAQIKGSQLLDIVESLLMSSVIHTTKMKNIAVKLSAALFMSTFLTFGAFAADDAVMMSLKDGASAMQSGKFQDSIDIYTKALVASDLSDQNKGKLLAAKANTMLEQGWATRQDKPLKDAIDTFNMALEFQNPETTPLAWADSNTKLADVYRSLAFGMYNNDMAEEGEKLYNQAIASLTAALIVLDKETSPQEWGEAQRALGQVNANSDTSLAITGKTSSATRLTESIKAFNAALEIYTKEADPVSWAGLNFQLGDIYTTLHQRQGGTVWLEKSITSHKKVLEVLKKEDNPSVWAQVQYFLGNGLVELGAAGKDKDLLKEAIVASRLATESDYFKTIFPEFYDRNLSNIGIAEGLIKKYDEEN